MLRNDPQPDNLRNLVCPANSHTAYDFYEGLIADIVLSELRVADPEVPALLTMLFMKTLNAGEILPRNPVEPDGAPLTLSAARFVGASERNFGYDRSQQARFLGGVGEGVLASVCLPPVQRSKTLFGYRVDNASRGLARTGRDLFVEAAELGVDILRDESKRWALLAEQYDFFSFALQEIPRKVAQQL